MEYTFGMPTPDVKKYYWVCQSCGMTDFSKSFKDTESDVSLHNEKYHKTSKPMYTVGIEFAYSSEG
jgi:hypothetical protein